MKNLQILNLARKDDLLYPTPKVYIFQQNILAKLDNVSIQTFWLDYISHDAPLILINRDDMLWESLIRWLTGSYSLARKPISQMRIDLWPLNHIIMRYCGAIMNPFILFSCKPLLFLWNADNCHKNSCLKTIFH